MEYCRRDKKSKHFSSGNDFTNQIFTGKLSRVDSVRVLRQGVISSPYFIPLRQSEHEMPKVEHGKWPWCEFSWRIEGTVIQKRVTSQDKTSWGIFVFLLYISFYLFIHSCTLGLHLNVPRTESSHLLILLTIGFLRNFGQKTCFHTIFSLTLSRRRPISYRNQSIDLQSKSLDWFLYVIGLRRERVTQNNSHSHTF